MEDFYKYAPEDKNEYLDTRVVDQIKWYDKKSIKSKRWFLSLKTVEIVLSLCIPFLTAYIATDGGTLRVIVGLLGVVIGVAAGLITLMKFHENWIEHRNVAEALKQEKFLFTTKAGLYKNLNSDDAFSTFVENFEDMIFRSTKKWAQSKKEDETTSQTASNHDPH